MFARWLSRPQNMQTPGIFRPFQFRAEPNNLLTSIEPAGTGESVPVEVIVAHDSGQAEGV